MKNNKKRNRINYALLVVIAVLILRQLFYKENKITQTHIQTPISRLQSEREETPPISELQLSVQFSQVSQPEKANNQIVEDVYDKVQAAYQQQDVFDENICSSDQVRASYKSVQTKVIKRLDSKYHHTHYELTKALQLNIYAEQISSTFEADLLDSLKFLQLNYINMLGESAQRPIVINLIITPSRSDYLYYSSFYFDHPESTLGVYFGGLNIAFVDYQGSDDKALKTALHESVHAFNAHIIGRTPRMFNEGMAEFFEDIKIKEGKPEIVSSKEKSAQEAYPVMQFFDDNEWAYLEVHQLYYSSWAWVYFMFNNSSEEGEASLINFMKQEQIDPCTFFSAEDSYSIIQEKYNTFEGDFIDWQND